MACNHEWTDDGEYLLVCTACGAQEDHNPGWRDMSIAPRDGTMLRLLVEFEEHSTEDADQAPTIGANNFDNSEVDEWKFSGWCWEHDHFVEGRGAPVGWLPMLDEPKTNPVAEEPALAAVVMPELTDDLRYIFGLMCFQCIAYAQALRGMGHTIANKAEDEQAATIHWMYGHYLRDPDNWRANAIAEIKAAKLGAEQK